MRLVDFTVTAVVIDSEFSGDAELLLLLELLPQDSEPPICSPPSRAAAPGTSTSTFGRGFLASGSNSSESGGTVTILKKREEEAVVFNKARQQCDNSFTFTLPGRISPYLPTHLFVTSLTSSACPY